MVIVLGIFVLTLLFFINMMYLRTTYEYFVYYDIDKIEEGKENIDRAISKYIFWYFLIRGHKTKFFEPYSATDLETTLIFGTAEVRDDKYMNRNCFIFIMELYAHLSAPTNFFVDSSLKHTTKTVKRHRLHFYRIPKRKPYGQQD